MARTKVWTNVAITYDDQQAKDVMKKSFQSIGEADAVSAFIDPIKYSMEYLHFNQSWNQLYLRQDARLMTHPQTSSVVAHQMKESGLYSIANVLMQKSNDVDYECLWRLGDWSATECTNESGQTKRPINVVQDECEKYHYFALKCLNNKDESGVNVFVDKARQQIIRRITLSSYECTRNIYKDLTALRLLQQIEEFCDVSRRTPWKR